MKIRSINIASFGGLKNVALDFGNGFNVIYGDNENGKTTVMSFIKMMFYGNERGSALVAKNPRKKYTPWDGSPMAGSIDFEHAGKFYRLEREFRSSNSTDKLTLCDLDFGTRQAVSGDIGTKFFGLSPAAFERSVFIGQFGSSEKDTSAEGEINSKLSNIVTTGDESTSYETVNTRLQKAKLSLMSKSGRAGIYDKNIQLISQLKSNLEKAETAQSNIVTVKAEIHQLSDEIKMLQKKSEELKAKVATEQDVRNAEKLKEMLNCKAQLDSLNETLKLSDGKLVDEIFVRKVTFCISKIDVLKEKIASKAAEANLLEQSINLATNPSDDISPEKAAELKTEISRLEETKSSLMQKITALEQEYNSRLNERDSVKNSKKALNLPLFITAILLTSICLALFIAKMAVYGGILAAIAVVTLLLAFILRPKDRKKIMNYQTMMLNMKTTDAELKTKEANISQSIASLSTQFETIKAVLNSNAAMIENQKNRLSECKAQIKTETSEMNEENETLISLFSRYKPVQNTDEIKQSLDEIGSKATKQKEIKQQLNYILKDVGNISYDEAREKLAQLNAFSTSDINDFQSLKQEYENVLTEISDKKANIATLTAQAKACQENSENPEAIKSEIEITEAKANAQKEFCQVADIAMQTLTESFAELRRSYGSVLEKKSGEIFSGITGGSYKSMSISKSFDINVEKTGIFGGKPLDYLSSGTADQAYLSLRLALSSLISETSGESLPILLDDALTQYDDGRIKAALDFLRKYSENEQIIMFTCHNSILQAAESSRAECKSL